MVHGDFPGDCLALGHAEEDDHVGRMEGAEKQFYLPVGGMPDSIVKMHACACELP